MNTVTTERAVPVMAEMALIDAQIALINEHVEWQRQCVRKIDAVLARYGVAAIHVNEIPLWDGPADPDPFYGD